MSSRSTPSKRWGFHGDEELRDDELAELPPFDGRNYFLWSSKLRSAVGWYKGALQVLEGHSFDIDKDSLQGLEHDLYEIIFRTIPYELFKVVKEYITVNSHVLERRGSAVYRYLEFFELETAPTADNEQYYEDTQAQDPAQDRAQGEQAASGSNGEGRKHLQEQGHRQASRRVQQAEVLQQEGSHRQTSNKTRAVRKAHRQAISSIPTIEEVQQQYERASRPDQERHESLDDYSERMSRYNQHAAIQGIYVPDATQVKTYIEGLYRVSDQKKAWEIVDREPDIRLSKLAGTLYFECGNVF